MDSPAPRRAGGRVMRRAQASVCSAMRRRRRWRFWRGSTSRPVRGRLYYTAVNTDAKSAATTGGESNKSQFDLSGPQLSRWRQMQIPVIAWLVYWAIRLIGPTLRTEIVGIENAIQIRSSGEPGIGAFWHRCIFSAVWIWRNRGVVVMNTVNFDGQR